MKSHPKSDTRALRSFRVLLPVIAAVALPLAAFGQATPPAPAPATSDLVRLSPFEVSSSGDTGYKAQNTLSGTRLNSSVADLGSTMTILTPQFWQDLGLTDTNDLILFTPGGDTRNGNNSDTNGGNLFWGDKTVFRGIATENIVRNYFRTEIPSDVYNTGRMEFVRGPNAILFGVAGDGTGLVNRATQDAVLSGNSTVYTTQVDNYESMRNSLNSNFVLIKNQLAVRLALLDSNQNKWLRPSDYQDQRRIYWAAQYQPIKQLSIKATYEHFGWVRSASSGVINFDSVTPWLNAGSPGRAANSGPVLAAQTPWFRGYSSNSPRLVAVYDQSSGGPVLQDWNNRTLGANRSVTGTTNVSLPANFMDRRFDVTGQSPTQVFSGSNVNFFADYALTKDLRVQLAVNDEAVFYDFIQANGNGRLNVDATTTLLSGAANPNFGKFFAISEAGFRLKQERFRRDQRLTASYHLDFKKFDRLKWLGVHDFAAMYERDTSQHFWDVLTLRNTTPLPGSSVFLGDQSNLVRFVNYVDINSSTIYGNRSSVNWVEEANKLPGVKAQWLPTGGPNAFKTILDSQLYVVQSRFWSDRLVTTVGWRRDVVDNATLNAASLTPLYPVGPGAPFMNYARTGALTRAPEIAPTNWSKGVVFHVLRNRGFLDALSLTYNTSTSFAVATFSNLPDRSPFPSQIGKTEDIGVRAEVFNRRIGFSLTRFEAAVQNLSFQLGPVTTRLSDLFNLINKNEFVNVSQVVDVQDKASKGYEFQLTANLTPNWRMMGSVSTYTTLNANVGLRTGSLIDQYKGQWLANPAAVVPNRGTETAQRTFDDMVFEYQVVKAQEGQRALLERKYKYVGVTNYSFTEGALKGFSLGGNFVWQSRPATGYLLRPVVNASTGARTFVPDAAKPNFGSTLLNVGASVGYQRRIWNNRFNWSLQLNVRNLLPVDPYVIRSGAETTAPEIAVTRSIYRGEPRTVTLTNTFRF
ncbi:MAG: hypothetical protein Q8N18_02885 [Opitutaceae bacterium]|nr:hypothetical protein [Opitutaceae bacterium]